MEERAYERTLPEMVRDRFIVVNRMHHCALDRNVSEVGLHRSQFFMLRHLAMSEEPPSQKDLAEAFEISPAAVAVTLKKLENQGLIVRDSAAGDSRRNEIRVTDAGRALLDANRLLAQGVDELMFYGLTEEELHSFSRSLTKMYENLRGLLEGRLSPPTEPTFGPPVRDAFSPRKDGSV